MSRLTLYLMLGYPGAGKTTIAQYITKKTGAVHLWADLERNQMFDQPAHTEAESQQLYERLNRRADQLLEERKSVVFDTNFSYYHDRQLLRGIADKNNADTVIAWLTTPIEVAKNRAVHANVVRNGYDFTMSGAKFDQIADHLEEPRENEKIIKIDGTNLDESALMRLLSQ